MASIKRVTIIKANGEISSSGNEPQKRKKGSKWLRPMEKIRRRMLRAQAEFADVLLDEHNKANRKKKDGWLRRGNLSLIKASRKAVKRMWRL